MKPTFKLELPFNGTSAAQALLALSLALRPFVASGFPLRVTIPKSLFDQLHASEIEEILYDHLATLNPEIESQIQLWVRPVNYLAFEVST